MTQLMIATIQAANHNTQQIGIVAAGMALALMVMFGFVAVMMRKVLRSKREASDDFVEKAPRTENEPAFMAASVQAVIRQLREQEKELERLHKIEKDRAEQTERLSEEVTRNMPAGLLVVNAQRIISSSNPAAEQALGVKTLGFRRFSEVLGEDSGLTKLIADCMSTGKIYRREEVIHETPSGDLRHLGVTISPIRRDSGKLNGAICLLSDLTELAALQQHIQLKDGLAALGELSAGIAHEFKNALATISGYAQLIPGASSHDAADYAKKILEQSRSITHVVTEFLKYAKPLEIPDESVELKNVVERVAEEVGQSKPKVKIVWSGTFGVVAGDEGLLRQALLNLARNGAEACDANEKPGRVEVSGEVIRERGVDVQYIMVRDNGSGISAGALTQLFKPFFTTKAAGTGLGLAVVQKIIVQHGGQVEAKNQAGGGAEFIVTLPMPKKVLEAVESVQASV
jgi:two-component system, NtrC family, sensor histidine kinase HydH